MKDSIYRAERSMFKHRIINIVCLLLLSMIIALLFYRLGELAQIKKQIEKIESLESKNKSIIYENR